jgi:hypothetical protein
MSPHSDDFIPLQLLNVLNRKVRCAHTRTTPTGKEKVLRLPTLYSMDKIMDTLFRLLCRTFEPFYSAHAAPESTIPCQQE